MHLEKLVNVGGCSARALGNALLAAVLENIRIGAFGLGHRANNGELTIKHLVVQTGSSHLVLHPAHARHHAHDAAHAAELFHLLELFGKIIEIKLARLHLLGHRCGFFRINGFGSFFDQRNNIAHAENTVGDALGIKLLKRVHLFAGGDQLDRLAGDGMHRKRCTATAITIHTSEHNAGNADTLIKITRQIDGILTGQAVGNEQDFMRIGGLANIRHFHHQRLVNMRAACGIENDDIMRAKFCSLNGASGNFHRRLTGNDRQRINTGLDAKLAKLFLRSRTARIERGHQHFFALTFSQALRDLARRRRLTRTLQADHHDDDRGRCIQIDGNAFSAKHFDKFVMDDLDDHLAGLDAFQDFGTNGLFPHLVGEGANHFQRNVSLDQCAAYFAQRRGHVGLRKGAASGKAVQDGAKTLLK